MLDRMMNRYASYAPLALRVVVGVIFAVHLRHGFFLPQGFEYALALFGAVVTLLLGGAGELALGPYLSRLWRRERKGGEPHGATA
jgi:uncharacterized membrane protein YphA (DoxX/SURF4 family)